MIHLLLLTTLATAGFETRPTAYTQRGSELCFPSGLRVTIQPDARQDVAAISVSLDGGSAADITPGSAHLLEHLVATHSWEVLPVGVKSDAATFPDATLYSYLTPTDELKPTLQAIGAWLDDPFVGVDEGDIARESLVIERELDWRGSDTYRGALHTLFEQLYPTPHPYRRAFADTNSEEPPDAKALEAYAKRWYTPGHATILISGNVGQRRIQAILEETFPEPVLWSKGSCSKRELPQVELPDPATEMKVVDGPVDDRTVYLGWSLPSAYQEDPVKMRMAVELLEVAVGARLHRVHSRPKDEYFTVSCDFIPGLQASTARCGITMPDPVEVDDVVKVARRGLSMLDDASLEDARHNFYERAKFRELGDSLRGIEYDLVPWSPMAEDKALFNHFMGKTYLLAHPFDDLVALTAEDATQLAETYLVAERAAVVVLEPGKGRMRQGGEGRFDGVESTATVPTGPVGDQAGTIPTDDLRHVTLENGLEVYILPWGKAPVVDVSLTLPGGGATDEVFGSTDVLFDHVLYDSTSLGRGITFGIAGEMIGGRYSLVDEGNRMRFGLEAAAGNVEDTMVLLRTLMDTAELYFPRDHSTLVDWTVAELRGDYDSPWHWAVMLRDDHTLGIHPTSFGRKARPAGWQTQLKERDFRRLVKERYTPSGARLYVVGNVEPFEAEKIVREHFGNWGKPGSSSPPPMPPAPERAPQRRVVLFERGGDDIATVELTCPVEQSTAAERAVLGEVAYDEVFERLRTATGASYDPSARVVRRGPGVYQLRLGATLTSETVGLGVTALLETIDQLTGLPPETLATARLEQARASRYGLLTTDQVASQLIESTWSPQGLAGLNPIREHIDEVSTMSITKALEHCAGHEIVTVVAVPAAAKKSLDEAGVAYEEYDWRAQATADLEPWDPKYVAK